MNIFYKNSKSKEYFLSFFFFFFFGGGGGRGDQWMNRRTGSNQYAPSTSSKLGA